MDQQQLAPKLAIISSHHMQEKSINNFWKLESLRINSAEKDVQDIANICGGKSEVFKHTGQFLESLEKRNISRHKENFTELQKTSRER